MNIASAAARFSPIASAAIAAITIAKSAEIFRVEELGDRAVERLIPGQDRQDDRGVNSEDGDRIEDSEEVEQEEHAHEGREADILDPLAPVAIDRMVFRDYMHRLINIAELATLAGGRSGENPRELLGSDQAFLFLALPC